MSEPTLLPIQVETTSADKVDRLVLVDDHLVAVLVHLDDPIHEEMQGRWHLEAGFGRCEGERLAPFADIAEAVAWVAAQTLRSPTN